MKLPNWVPAVRRPWNMAFGSTWDKMTHEERQWSFLFDASITAVVVAAMLLIGGCQRTDTSSPRGGTTETQRTTGTDVRSLSDGAFLFEDPETGCQYWVLDNWRAMTPRYAWGPSGLYIAGCKGINQ